MFHQNLSSNIDVSFPIITQNNDDYKIITKANLYRFLASYNSNIFEQP